MANIIKPKRRSADATAPTTAILADGEIAINAVSKTIYQRVGAEVVAVANYSEGGGSLAELDQSGATTGQFPMWDGTGWVPTTAAGNIGTPVSHPWEELKLATNRTLTNNTTMQNWFASPDSISLEANSEYELEGYFVSTNGTTSHGLNMQFAALSGATIQWTAIGAKTVAATQATAVRTTSTNTFNTSRNVTTASTVGGNSVLIKGVIKTTTAGSLQPQVAQSANSGSFTVLEGTFFRVRKAGTKLVGGGGGGGQEVGDVLVSARTDLTAPDWLACDGSSHTRASYPDLEGWMEGGASLDVPDKLTDPATLPTGSGYGAAFSPDGSHLAVAHNYSPYITIYKRSGDTFTKLADPATLPTSSASGAAFSPDGTYLAVTHNNSPYITIYKRSGDDFTKLANPATLPPGNARGAAFSPDGTYLAVGTYASPYIVIYKRSGDTFTKLADPATLPTNTAYGAAFSPDGTYLVVPHATSPFVTIYKRSGDDFTKLANPATLPTGLGYEAAFSPDGTYLVVSHENAPYITIYKETDDPLSFKTPVLPQPAPLKAYIKAS